MAKPVKEYSLGHIKAAIFLNEQYNSQSIKLQKSFKDKSGNWKNSDYFNTTDLRDLYGLIGAMLHKQVKVKDLSSSGNEPAPQAAAEVFDATPVQDDSTVPF